MPIMSTEEVLAYLDKNDKPAEPVTEAKEPETPETVPSTEPAVDDSKSEVKDVTSPEDKAATTNDDAPKSEEVKQPDTKADNPDAKPAETKDEKVDTTPEKNDPHKKEMDKRDYAFIREKNKRKEQKAKYEARIKELEAELEKRKGLEEQHFKKEDGSPDSAAYVRNEFAKRDMQDELKSIRERDAYEQQQLDIEQDRIITEHCFEGKDLDDYRNLIATRGKDFADALKDNDPNNVVLNYLDTLQEYPVVLRELMTNMDTLRRLFRSKDPEALKYNVRVISDQILENHHAPKSAPVAPTQSAQPAAQEPKPNIPVIGKQITNTSSTSTPTVPDINYWNRYLKEHPRG